MSKPRAREFIVTRTRRTVEQAKLIADDSFNAREQADTNDPDWVKIEETEHNTVEEVRK